MIKVAFTKIQSKIKINRLMQGVCYGCSLSMLLCIIAANLHSNLIDKEHKGDHEIKIVNFADDTTISLRDITCLNRIQVIWKLYEDASS